MKDLLTDSVNMRAATEADMPTLVDVIRQSFAEVAKREGLNETDHPTALLHLSGSQGELVMLLKSAKDKTKHTELLLPNGLTLDVPHAGQRTAWVLLNASLAGVAQLDYTSLSPWALGASRSSVSARSRSVVPTTSKFTMHGRRPPG